VSRDLQIHLILDNYGTHTHPDVKSWLAKHPRFKCTSPRPARSPGGVSRSAPTVGRRPGRFAGAG
jgi:hypothetical protein